MSLAVLLIEDNRDDIELTERVFNHNHIRNPLDVCKTGGEGLTYLQSQQIPLPCLVLLDLGLPDISGLNVLKIMKSDQRTHSLCVFILTVDKSQETLLESMKLGADFFMRKTIDIAKLLDAASRCGVMLELE